MAAETSQPALLGSYLVPMQQRYLARVQEVETALYPADEAATPESLKFRMQNAGSFFYVALDQNDELIGYICGTTTKKDALGEYFTHDRGAQGPQVSPQMRTQ